MNMFKLYLTLHGWSTTFHGIEDMFHHHEYYVWFDNRFHGNKSKEVVMIMEKSLYPSKQCDIPNKFWHRIDL